MCDPRPGNNISHPLSSLLYQSIYSRLSGHEDVNDADYLKHDPIVRHVTGGKAIDCQAAGSSEIHWFETACLTLDENFDQLSQALGESVMKAHRQRRLTEIIIDMDSSVSEAYGKQEGVEYNGHFQTTCYHPPFCFNQFVDLEGMMLRNGAVYSANACEKVLQPIIDRYTELSIKKYFRGDAAFAKPDLYVQLENADYEYAIRLKENPRLMDAISAYLIRPVGRPSKKPRIFYYSFYQAESWDQARRVVAKIEWHQDQLFPRIGFVVTNMKRSSQHVIKFLISVELVNNG